MTASDPTLSAPLRTLAERWLQRPLTAEEAGRLARFQASLAGGDAPAAASAGIAGTVAEARRQAETAIQGVLEAARQAAERIAREREQEDRAILRMIESAGSLAELRPSALPGADDAAPAARMAIAQIADRLANLVRAEVRTCFERQLAPLASRIEAMLDGAQPQPPAGAGPSAPAAPPPPSAPAPSAPPEPPPVPSTPPVPAASPVQPAPPVPATPSLPVPPASSVPAAPSPPAPATPSPPVSPLPSVPVAPPLPVAPASPVPPDAPAAGP